MIRALHLYPRQMNVYGDFGNMLALRRRCEWRGLDIELLEHHPGAPFPADVDLVVGGGGQDSGQSAIQDDLKALGPTLKGLADSGVPMLMVCGLFQLFGRRFEPFEAEPIEGIGIFDLVTTAQKKRLVGNIVLDTFLGQVVGYENHSGLTRLGEGQEPFGRVVKGTGNDGESGVEGARFRNVIGTYLHGPILPKNPAVADWLIARACEHAGEAATLAPLDDAAEDAARATAATRPR